jgi:hypothetical protein
MIATAPGRSRYQRKSPPHVERRVEIDELEAARGFGALECSQVTRFRHGGRKKSFTLAWSRPYHEVDRGRDQPSPCAQRTDLNLGHVLQQAR